MENKTKKKNLKKRKTICVNPPGACAETIWDGKTTTASRAVKCV